MYKWLTIMGIVCLGFIVVLLSLGYLLKENEVATKALKQKLDQQKQLNSFDKKSSKAVLTFVDSDETITQESVDKLKSIIVKNLTCTSSQQCELVNIKLPQLNCTVAVNSIGASLLQKELHKERDKMFLTSENEKNSCNVEQQNVTSVCKQNICELIH